MDQERWRRIQQLFHEASGLPREQRHTFIESRCPGDSDLETDVLALLEEDERVATSFELDVGRMARDILDDQAWPPLRRIGPYRLERLLGEGGMGVVYLATREDLGTVVAVKILRDAWVSPSRRRRFIDEQRTLAQLVHPHIVTLHDAHTLPDGTPCFVMEHVEGTSLTDYCRERRCSISERLQLFRQVCEAVHYAHQRLVVHRDLKPSNILVTPQGTVKLLDFGISRALEKLDGPTDHTATLLRLLTPAYAAPEQVRGEAADVRVDVYSLGVILYELLAGRRPFDLSNRTPAEAEATIVEGDPERPSVVARASNERATMSRAAWGDLDVLSLTAMHNDRDRRYQTVEALVRDLDHFLNSEPLDARPDGVVYRVRKFTSRNRRALSAAAVTCFAIVVLLVFFTWRLAAERDAAVAAVQRSERVEQLILNLFQGEDQSGAGPAQDLRVVTLIDRGVREADALDTEPAVQADLYHTLGGIYQRLGSFDRAETLLGTALDRRRSLGVSGRAGEVESLVALGLLRVEQARFDEGEQLVREGLDLARRLRPAGDQRVARAAAALGKVLEARGDYGGAIPPLEEALSLHSAAGAPTVELSRTLTTLANVHYYSGRYETAETLNRRVLEIDRQLFGHRHPYVADDLVNLGAIRYERGDHVEAERYYREALEITEAWYGPDHPKTAGNLSMLGRALVAQQRHDEALVAVRRSLDIRERVFGVDHPRVAVLLGDLGAIALAREDHDEAEAQYQRMVDIYRAAYDDRHAFIAMALSSLARVHLARGDYLRAEEVARDSVARFLDTLPAEHPRTAAARVLLGSALVAQQRYREAKEHTKAAHQVLKGSLASATALDRARQDLITIYTALGRPDDASAVREALTDEDR